MFITSALGFKIRHVIFKDDTLHHGIRGRRVSEVRQIPQGEAKKYEFFRMGNIGKIIYFGKEKGDILKSYSGQNSYRNAIIPFVPRGVNPDLDSQQLLF